MFEFINDEEARGQVGIGTLIVFIAMVLVAAIAAGVLINTAGFLQTQAEETGQDSTDQVANNINVIGTVGEVNDPESLGSSPDTGVYEARLTVQKSAGAGDVDLGGLSIQYVGPSSFANLVHPTTQLQSDGSAPAGGFENVYFVQSIMAETPGDSVMTAEGDRYSIVIPLGYFADSGTDLKDSSAGTVIADKAYGTGSDVDIDLDSLTGAVDNSELSLLKSGSTTELTITTESGSQRYVTLSVPDSLVGNEGGTVKL